MNIGKDTKEMVALHEAGWSLDQIGEKFGIKRQALLQRLKRWGCDCSPPKKYETLDRERLETLYYENKTLLEIASEFSVDVSTIGKALHHFNTPERPPLNRFDESAQRAVALEMVEDYKSGMLWKEIAAKYGFKQHPSMKKRLALLDIPLPIRRQNLLLTEEAKKTLEDLYLTQRLRIIDIVKHFKTSHTIVSGALKFHKIPKRQSIVDNHIDKFRKLAVGDTITIKTNAKYPINNLHEISKRIPIKISVRRCGDGNFKVMRIK